MTSEPARDGRPAKPLLRALAGEAVWPPPMWLMRQAGRYLPEYREVRARAGGFVELCTAPALAAEVTLQPIRRYGMDGAILFSDISMLPWAMGHPLEVEDGVGPVMPPVRDSAALARLDVEGVAERAAPILEVVRRVRAGLAAEAPGTALIGFAGGVFTVACYMVEGRGTREFHAARALAHSDPALFGRLVDSLVEGTAAYLCAQAEAGAEALMLFDSWAGLLSPPGFRRWVVEPTAAVVRRVRERFPSVPIVGFPRLAGPMLAEYARGTGVGTVAMDTAMDPRWAAEAVGPGVTLQGNLDPIALVAGGAALEGEARAILGAMRGRPYVFNLGHGVDKTTPPEHVAALVRVVRNG